MKRIIGFLEEEDKERSVSHEHIRTWKQKFLDTVVSFYSVHEKFVESASASYKS